MASDRPVPGGNKESMLLVADAQNLYYSARELFGRGSRIDFKKLRNKISGDRSFGAIYSVAYVPEKSDEAGSLSKALHRLGYEQVVRTEHFDQQTEQLLVLAKTYSVLAVASGDGAFLGLYKQAREAGIRVEVFAFVDATNSEIAANVDALTYLKPDVLLGSFATLESVNG